MVVKKIPLRLRAGTPTEVRGIRESNFKSIQIFLYQISNNAHLTKEFIPSIQSRLKAKHFHPNFKLTQFLTGHGNFKAYLKRFNLSPADQCSCSSDTIQNAKHLILACVLNSLRKDVQLMNCIQKNNIVWPPPLSAFVEGNSSFTSFCAYINSIFPCII
ncbi:RNase H domain-containing protein [Trichonephila clavipes]|nr:RNase H domain-containing protein [Trichonephila clavipes]